MIKIINSFLSAAELIGGEISSILIKLPHSLQAEVEEIRLRAGRPLCLTAAGKIKYVSENGEVSSSGQAARTVAPEELALAVKNICGSSVYSHTEEIMNGFISMPYGCRAGIVGAFRQGRFCDVSSLNIRIARSLPFAAGEFAKSYGGGSVLICGPPACGKTTFLRSLIRAVSQGECGRAYRVSLIDTRGEIAALLDGVPTLDIGINTDVFSGRDKAEAIEAAIRSMSPEIIAFDEIGSLAELKAVKSGVNCGAYVFATAHISSAELLLKRTITRALISECGFSKAVFLSGVGLSPEIYEIRGGKLCGL